MLDAWDEAIYFILKLGEPLVHSVLLIWMFLLISDRMLRMAGSEIAGELAGCLLLEQSCLFSVFSLGFCFNDILFIVDSDGMAGLNEVHNLLFRLL